MMQLSTYLLCFLRKCLRLRHSIESLISCSEADSQPTAIRRLLHTDHVTPECYDGRQCIYVCGNTCITAAAETE